MFYPRLEALEARDCPASSATLKNGVLALLGDARDNVLTVRASAADPTMLDVVLDGVIDQTVSRAAVTTIVLDGGNGNDLLSNLTGTSGTAITGAIRGGRGDDNLVSFGADVIFGDAGNDQIYQIVAPGYIDGGAGRDRVITSVATVFVPDPRDETPVIFGQVAAGFAVAGRVLYFAGTANNDTATVLARGKQLVVSFNGMTQTFNARDVDAVATVLGAGDDSYFVAASLDVVGYGAGGNDTLIHQGRGFSLLKGGGGNDLLVGGSGPNDLSGDPGSDTLIGGNSRDVFRTDAADTLLFRSAVDIVLGFEKARSSRPINPAAVRT